MSIKMLHENSDFIWSLSGDKSNDFSYYSKRGLLSMIYLATLIYWLNDKSEKDIATKNFISKSVDGIVDGVSRLKQLSLLKGLAENFMSRYAKKTS
jgi:ubiquinone biosynthesis protein COQ9